MLHFESWFYEKKRKLSPLNQVAKLDTCNNHTFCMGNNFRWMEELKRGSHYVMVSAGRGGKSNLRVESYGLGRDPMDKDDRCKVVQNHASFGIFSMSNLKPEKKYVEQQPHTLPPLSSHPTVSKRKQTRLWLFWCQPSKKGEERKPAYF